MTVESMSALLAVFASYNQADRWLVLVLAVTCLIPPPYAATSQAGRARLCLSPLPSLSLKRLPVVFGGEHADIHIVRRPCPPSNSLRAIGGICGYRPRHAYIVAIARTPAAAMIAATAVYCAALGSVPASPATTPNHTTSNTARAPSRTHGLPLATDAERLGAGAVTAA